MSEVGALTVTDEERQAAYEEVWKAGELITILGVYNDLLMNEAANETLAEFIRNKIRSIVKDPETAEALCPTDHPFGTKRPCLDTNYYETFNLPHVRLVDLRKHPIATITETGIDTSSESFEFDVIVFATGFDAMTGAIVAVDITGRDGLSLEDKWADGPKTYLGLTVAGFPNLFTITGPGSPSVLSNMVVSIEQHVDWICDCLDHMRSEGLDVIEPTATAEAGWVQHVNDFGDITLYPTGQLVVHGRQRARQAAGVPAVRRRRRRVPHRVRRGRRVATTSASRSRATERRRVNDGVIRNVQPDVALVLEMIAGLGLPTDRVDVGRRARASSPPRPARAGLRDPTSARSSTARCPAPTATSSTACTVRPPTARIPSSPTSTAAAGCSAATTRTIRSAATCACGPTRSSCRSTTATRPRLASRPRPTTVSPRCSGSPPTPTSWAACPASSRSPAGVPAATSPPSSARWRATPAARRSRARCC